MFTHKQKLDISNIVQKAIKATGHPEIDKKKETVFELHVHGKDSSSYVLIKNAKQFKNDLPDDDDKKK